MPFRYTRRERTRILMREEGAQGVGRNFVVSTALGMTETEEGVREARKHRFSFEQ